MLLSISFEPPFWFVFEGKPRGSQPTLKGTPILRNQLRLKWVKGSLGPLARPQFLSQMVAEGCGAPPDLQIRARKKEKTEKAEKPKAGHDQIAPPPPAPPQGFRCTRSLLDHKIL